MKKILLMTTLLLGACGHYEPEPLFIQDATGNFHRINYVSSCSVSDNDLSARECVARGGLVGQWPEHKEKAFLERVAKSPGCSSGCQQMLLDSAIRDLSRKIDSTRVIVLVR